jgi:hypothetical protein
MAPTWGRPTLWFGRPMSAASHAAFRPRHCLVGPHLVYVGAGALYVSFLCQMGLFWMCNADSDVLCISIASSACFHVIPDLCPCNQQFTNTCGIC